jgi:hypothetical protein
MKGNQKLPNVHLLCVFEWNDSSLNRVLEWEEELTLWSVKLLFLIVIYHYINYNLFLKFSGS